MLAARAYRNLTTVRQTGGGLIGGCASGWCMLPFIDRPFRVIRVDFGVSATCIPGVDDRRVLNGIFWVLRSGAPWRELPETYAPRTTCYNRFVRWQQAVGYGTGSWIPWPPVMTSLCRRSIPSPVHQHGACIAHNSRQDTVAREEA
jgi:putative transposase of IS4/5 family DUF4096